MKYRVPPSTTVWVWAVALLALIVVSAGTAVSADQKALGTKAALQQGVIPLGDLGTINPSVVFGNANYGTAGTALRNQKAGGIVVSGVNPPVQGAFLYWAVISQGGPPLAAHKLTIQRLAPTAAGPVTLTGSSVGVGAPPCWPGDRLTVFRATIPATIGNGNGLYRVTLLAGASGLTDGEDPWDGNTILPLWEGASIVMVGTGSGTVGIYDIGISGNMFFDFLTYTLNLPAFASGSLTLWDNIGADGQIGNSRTASIGSETTSINGVAVAGPGSAYNDSDWNGSSGFPLPQLWDDTGHDITAATPSGTSTLGVNFTSQGDCLNAVANVVEVH